MPFVIFRGGPMDGPSIYEVSEDQVRSRSRLVFDDDPRAPVVYQLTGETAMTDRGGAVYANHVGAGDSTT